MLREIPFDICMLLYAYVLSESKVIDVQSREFHDTGRMRTAYAFSNDAACFLIILSEYFVDLGKMSKQKLLDYLIRNWQRLTFRSIKDFLKKGVNLIALCDKYMKLRLINCCFRAVFNDYMLKHNLVFRYPSAAPIF